ncbi:uncharacterized protein LOC128215003 isoform X3 [Mya arenaria]|uniref:uncharacterized protein LOC128215003 isoform X3 n=1 Tax=Mya arenaria TaxID=6604 RepID=UPI0022DF0A5D|nr:uncharacterized protein LOC128215003 isoform X3 [Mya arenaria]
MATLMEFILSVLLLSATVHSEEPAWYISGVNVAPGKPASQIPGTHGDIKASSAVNEDITELQHSVPCANLNFKRHGQYFFFWDAKLRGSYFISGIRIYHKDNGAREKLYGLTIVTFFQSWKTVFADNETHLSRCTEYHERKDKPLVCQDIIDVALEPPVQADFVRLRSKHNVTLCDVEIVAVYNSKQFYLVNGSSDVVCAANGSLRWAAQQPYLASICIAQKNGHFWAKTRDCLRDDKCEVGETITFECREDFQMMQINATCLSNYTWSSAPICTPLSLLKSTGTIIGGSAAVGVVGIPSVIAFLLFLYKRRLRKGKSKTLHEKPDEPMEDWRVYLETNETHKTDRKNGEDPELSSSDTYLTPVVTDNNYYENVFVYESIE